eukprot:CFRG5340T1
MLRSIARIGLPLRYQNTPSIRNQIWCSGVWMETRVANYTSNVTPNESAHNPLMEMEEEFIKYADVKGEHVVPAVQWALADFKANIQKLENSLSTNPSLTWEDVMDEREKSAKKIGRVWGAVTHIHGVRDSVTFRKGYEAVLEEVVTAFSHYGQSQPLFKAYTTLAQSSTYSLSDTQKRVLDKAILDATHGGVGLDNEEDKSRFNAISVELSSLTTQFSQNVLDSTNAFRYIVTNHEQMKGVPQDLKLAMATAASKPFPPTDPTTDTQRDTPIDAEKGPWLLSLDFPVFGPFMQMCESAELREMLYKAYAHRASEFDVSKPSEEGKDSYDNAKIIKRILDLRREKAQLLGYDSYAELSLSTKMAKSLSAVNDLLDPLFQSCGPAAAADLEQLAKYARDNGHTGDLQLWDVSYWAEKQKQSLFGLTDEDLRPYFSFPTVLEGLFSLARDVFGIQITETELPSGVAWDEHVRLYEVCEGRQGAEEKVIAKFFLDPYSRPGVKRGGAWMDVCVGKSKSLNQNVPVAFLVCNQTSPLKDEGTANEAHSPSLLTFREVETLFHEFGHGLQHMLTTVDCGDASGINGVEWDAVELPSQMMENWCYERSTINSISKHHLTNEPLPESMFNELCRARTYMAGNMMLRQLLFSSIDLQLHSDNDKVAAVNPFEQWQKMCKEKNALPPLPTDRFLCSFSHIFAGGYSAGYYSYKWAEVLSQDAYGAFAEAKTAEAKKEVGLRFRDTVLSLGGSRDPMTVFETFRGRQPTTDALLDTYGLKVGNE